jgi:hypothetical protein
MIIQAKIAKVWHQFLINFYSIFIANIKDSYCVTGSQDLVGATLKELIFYVWFGLVAI